MEYGAYWSKLGNKLGTEKVLGEQARLEPFELYLLGLSGSYLREATKQIPSVKHYLFALFLDEKAPN